MADESGSNVNSFNPFEVSDQLLELTMRSQRLASQWWTEQLSNPRNPAALDPFNLSGAYKELMSGLMQNPDRLIGAQAAYCRDAINLWQGTARRMLGLEAEPVIEPSKSDNRFRDEQWTDNPLFDHIKQSYLLASRFVESALDGAEMLEDKDAEKLGFFTRQFIDAMAPTNFPTTNPAVVRETIGTLGENLIRGFNNFLNDLERGDGQLQITMADPNAFKLGENVATTPGKVVYQNRMFQLLQYEPATEKVYKRPLLIVPPWINKYYIMDLQPKNSLIKWLVDQGHTVFVMSWVNPDESYAETGFDDYVLEGIYAALDAIEQATGEKQLNAMGYCIGGTLLAAALAQMASRKDDRIKSATFFTTMIDFSEPGEIGVFIDDNQVDSLEQRMREQGYLEGSNMASAFSMLRANDLIWMFAINNYLLGKDPLVFDLLYWNSDSTRMPAEMHSYYLRNMYMENRLKDPGGISIDGQPIDIAKIKVPSYFLSTREDHIAPWKSTYTGASLLSGPVRFVLGGSGHIAGVINPPAAEKYCYWVNNGRKLPADPEQWLKKAKQNGGSWWTDWNAWVTGLNDAKVPARQPGAGKLPVIEDAPGSYVATRMT